MPYTSRMRRRAECGIAACVYLWTGPLVSLPLIISACQLFRIPHVTLVLTLLSQSLPNTRLACPPLILVYQSRQSHADVRGWACPFMEYEDEGVLALNAS